MNAIAFFGEHGSFVHRFHGHAGRDHFRLFATDEPGSWTDRSPWLPRHRHCAHGIVIEGWILGRLMLDRREFRRLHRGRPLLLLLLLRAFEHPLLPIDLLHDIVVLLNNDMIVDPGFLRPLLDGFGPNTFAVSSQIRNQDPAVMREETGWTSAVFRRGFLDYTHRDVNGQELSRPCYPVLWAGGGSSAFHRTRFLALGGFHEI